jgi:hypothetical protein
MQIYKPLNNFNLIAFTIFKSLYISLQLCFLIYSLKTQIEISTNNYIYLIFTLGLNLLLDLFQVLEHAIACYYFYNKEFIDSEDYSNKKLLLRINNNFYYYVCHIYNVIMSMYSVNLITFSFIFVNNIQEITDSFIHGMFMYLIVVGFFFLAIGIIFIILILVTSFLIQRSNNEINARLESLRDILNSIVPNGLSSEIINNIKTSNEILEDNCSICLSKENKEIMILSCNHNFHSECLRQWLKNNKKCPICRIEII